MTRLLLRWLAVLLLAAPASHAAPVAPATILVIESYNVEMEWDVSYKQALNELLGKQYHLEFVQMNTKRLPPERHAAMADLAWARYQQVHPVLVILGDDAALKFLWERFSKTTTPVVYLGINNNPRAYFDAAQARNITGVLERPNLKRSIAFSHRLLPAAKRALVLFDTDVTSQVVRAETFEHHDRLQIDGIDIDLKLVPRWEHWMDEVVNARGKYDMIFLGLYQALRDKNNNSANTSDEVARWTSAHAPVPVFGFWDWAVGPEKTVGGLVLYGHEQGRVAAELALRILSGTPPERIFPVVADRGRFLFSKTQLRRFGLTLPPDIAAEASSTE